MFNKLYRMIWTDKNPAVAQYVGFKWTEQNIEIRNSAENIHMGSFYMLCTTESN